MKKRKHSRWIALKAKDIDVERLRKISEITETNMSNLIRLLIKEKYEKLCLVDKTSKNVK